MPGKSLVRYVAADGSDADKISRERRASILDKPGTPAARLASSLKGPKGEWLGMLDVTRGLQELNPELERPKHLKDATGRYCYSRDQLNATNRRIVPGNELERVPMAQLDGMVEGAEPDQLIVVCCTRADNKDAVRAEKACEHVQAAVLAGEMDAPAHGKKSHRAGPGGMQGTTTQPETAPFRLVKVEMSESRAMVQKYNIFSIPFFLMFHGGKLVHASQLGGKRSRVRAQTKNSELTQHMDDPPKILLVEPCFKFQLQIEKLLKKERMDWDLANSAAEAVQQIQRLASSSTGIGKVKQEYGIILMSDELDDAGVGNISRAVKGRLQGPAAMQSAAQAAETGGARPKTKPNTLMAAMVGRGAAYDLPQRSGLVEDPSLCLEPQMASVVSAAVTRSVKAVSMHQLCKRWAAKEAMKPAASQGGGTTFHIGLTLENIIAAMKQAREDGRRGRVVGVESVQKGGGLALASSETKVRGTAMEFAPGESFIKDPTHVLA
jgi:hypothetical protein